MTNLFRRRRQESSLSRDAVSSVMSCTMPGCSNDTALPCAYRDRWRRACPTALCPAHRVTVTGIAYCRRHAGTVQAIGELSMDSHGRPDLDDRTPSLVNWIARDLDTNIRALLACTTLAGESIVVDEVVRLARDRNRTARWERSWRILENTGIVLKVTVRVSEEDDSRVHVTVGSEVVADAVPPWIARRREGAEVEAPIDIMQRQRFYRSLEESIAGAVRRFRVRGDRPGSRQ